MHLVHRVVGLKQNAKTLADGELISKKRQRRQSMLPNPKWEDNEEIVKVRNSFSYEDSRALSDTWKKLQGHTGLRKIDNLLNDVFSYVFENKKVKKMIMYAAFERGTKEKEIPCITSAYDHARFLSCVLDYIIDPTTNDYSEHLHCFGPAFIGKRHTKLHCYGFLSEFWEIFGEKMAMVIAHQHHVRGYPYGMRAWTTLSAMLTDRMRAGFEQQYGIKNALDIKIEAPFAMIRSMPNTPSKKLRKISKRSESCVSEILRMRQEHGSRKYSRSNDSTPPQTPPKITRSISVDRGDDRNKRKVCLVEPNFRDLSNESLIEEKEIEEKEVEEKEENHMNFDAFPSEKQPSPVEDERKVESIPEMPKEEINPKTRHETTPHEVVQLLYGVATGIFAIFIFYFMLYYRL